MKRMTAILCAAALAAGPAQEARAAGLRFKEPEFAIPAGSLAVDAAGAAAVETEAQAAALQVSAPSAVLMEASTGQVIYEKGADEKRSPASVTKVMTLILIFDALAEGKIALTDEVVTSAYAKSMGGSQVFGRLPGISGGGGGPDGGDSYQVHCHRLGK